MALRAAASGKGLLHDASALKAMELYSDVAILHLPVVRFAITPKGSELPAATDWFTISSWQQRKR
jgi:hypothetical protein